MSRKTGTRSSSNQFAKKQKGIDDEDSLNLEENGSVSDHDHDLILNEDESVSRGNGRSSEHETLMTKEETEQEDGENLNGVELKSKGGRRERSSGKFDLMINSDHDRSRIGVKFQADIPPFSEFSHNTRRKGSGELENLTPLWSNEVLPQHIDLDDFLSQCRALRTPSAGSVLRVHGTRGNVYWCVFLRDLEDDPSFSSTSKTEKRVRVFGGEKFDLKAHSIPFSSLIGWSDEAECLELLALANFDQEKALKKLDLTYQNIGCWRDKFSKWSAMEVQMLCDGASHNNDLDTLVDTLTSKNKAEVFDFYNHLLRCRGSDFNMVARLFTAAEKARVGNGLTDPLDQPSEFKEGQLRKSKRERSAGRIRLPGEAISDDEGIESLPTSQALAQHASKGKPANSKSTSSKSSNSKAKSDTDKKRAAGATEVTAASSKAEAKKRGSSSNPSNANGRKTKRADRSGGSDEELLVSQHRGESGEAWTAEYLEQHRSVTPRQKEMLHKSFNFLYHAQEVLETSEFFQLIQALVDYDNGILEVPKLMAIAAECLPSENTELMEGFVSFLPDRAKAIFEKFQEDDEMR